MKRWLQGMLCFTVALCLAAAPCRNCRPQAAAPAPSGHDCCPKPAPVKDCAGGETSGCKWQPSEKAAPESKIEVGWQISDGPPPGGEQPEKASPQPPPPHAPVPPGSPPHLYLLNSVLLI
jgi:hypothetical protein